MPWIDVSGNDIGNYTLKARKVIRAAAARKV